MQATRLNWSTLVKKFARILGLVSALSLPVLSTIPAQAVVITDGAWRQSGGTEENPSAGFRASIALANQQQFWGLVNLSDDGEEWGMSSGTWLGNAGGHAYVLTAAHVYSKFPKADEYVFRSHDGSVHRADAVYVNDRYVNVDDTNGDDVAIVKLHDEIHGAGQPPMLYGGHNEKGQRVVIVGFGTRGTGSVGEDDDYNDGEQAAAATNVIDDLESNDNFFGVTLRHEARGTAPLDGLLGAGDSGGSTWMHTDSGWVIAGINSNGDGDSKYGDHSYFTRVSGLRNWIKARFPQARFSSN